MIISIHNLYDKMLLIKRMRLATGWGEIFAKEIFGLRTIIQHIKRSLRIQQ